MTCQISPASLDDAPALAAILSDWIDATDWMPRLNSTADDLAFVTGLVAAGGTFVARRDGQTLGFVACHGECLVALYVAVDMRGQGVGKKLLDVAKRAHVRIALWVFEANDGARRFYARERFREDGRTAGNNEEGLPDVRMVWFKSEEPKDA